MAKRNNTREVAQEEVAQEEVAQEEVDKESLLVKIELLEIENMELKRQIDNLKANTNNKRFRPAPSN